MIWLIGNRGMLGTELSNLMEYLNIPYIGTDRDVDITNPDALNGYADNKQIKYIINCAAYTAVDKAEDDVANCEKLNNLGASNIAIFSKNIQARFVHISTDYVFDGTASVPYKEDDLVNPIGVYGRTKRDGETAILKSNPNSYIIRTAWLYGRYGNNFVSTMIKLMNERPELKVVNDQKGSPTWAYDLSRIIIEFVKTGIPFGIYHYSNEGSITWYDFACEIYRQGKELGLINNNCSIKPCTSAEFPSKVKRPNYSVLDKGKIKLMLNISIPQWQDSLREYLCQFQ